MSDRDQSDVAREEQITVNRSPDYRTLIPDIFRSKIGPGECVIVLSRTGSAPGVSMDTSIIEELEEVLLSWSNLKILAMHLASLTAAIEAEVGPIPIPAHIAVNAKFRMDRQREVIRNLHISPSFTFAEFAQQWSATATQPERSTAPEPAPTDPPQPTRRGRRKAQF